MTSHLGLKAHLETCDVMSLGYSEIIETFRKFSHGGDGAGVTYSKDIAQLMNLHSLTQMLLKDLNVAICDQIYLGGYTDPGLEEEKEEQYFPSKIEFCQLKNPYRFVKRKKSSES